MSDQFKDLNFSISQKMPLKKALEIVYIEMTVTVQKGANYGPEDQIKEAMIVIGQHLELLQQYKKKYGDKI